MPASCAFVLQKDSHCKRLRAVCYHFFKFTIENNKHKVTIGYGGRLSISVCWMRMTKLQSNVRFRMRRKWATSGLRPLMLNAAFKNSGPLHAGCDCNRKGNVVLISTGSLFWQSNKVQFRTIFIQTVIKFSSGQSLFRQVIKFSLGQSLFRQVIKFSLGQSLFRRVIKFSSRQYPHAWQQPLS